MGDSEKNLADGKLSDDIIVEDKIGTGVIGKIIVQRNLQQKGD